MTQTTLPAGQSPIALAPLLSQPLACFLAYPVAIAHCKMTRDHGSVSNLLFQDVVTDWKAQRAPGGAALFFKLPTQVISSLKPTQLADVVLARYRSSFTLRRCVGIRIKRILGKKAKL